MSQKEKRDYLVKLAYNSAHCEGNTEPIETFYKYYDKHYEEYKEKRQI